MNTTEPRPPLAPIPLTRGEKIAIVATAIGVTALLGLVAKNTIDLHVLTKRNDMHAGTILSILYTLEDQDIIQNLKIGG